MENNLKRLVKYVLVFLCIFVPFRELISSYTISYIKFLPDVMIWGLLVIVVFKNRFKLNLKTYDIFLIAFLIIGLISSLINDVSILAYCLQVRSITTMYVLFYVLRNVRLSKKDLKPTVITLIVVTTVLITFGIFEHLTSKCLFYPMEWAQNINYESNFSRVYSLVKNPNTFAIFIFMTMLLAYYAEKEEDYKISKIYYCLVFLGIFLSASRSTMIVLALFFLYLLYEAIKKKEFKPFIVMVTILVIASGLSFGLDYAKAKINFTCSWSSESNLPTSNPTQKPNKPDNSMVDRWQETISGNTLKNSSENGRIFIIKTGFKIFKDYPILGTGFGTYGSAASKMVTPKLYEKYDLYENFYSDNDYIKIIVETGIIGTLIYAGFVLSLLVYCLDSKYKVLMYITFLMIGMFYNVSEMQIMCLVLYISFIFFEKDRMIKKRKSKKGKDQIKNIAIFTDNLHVGGIQKSVVNLLKNIDPERYEVDLYLFDKDSFYDIPKGINTVYLDRPNKIFKFIPFNVVKCILKVNVSNKEYDVAIDFDSYQMHTAIGAISANAQKRAIWIHNDVPIKLKEEPKYRILHFFFKDKYKYFDSFCAVSKGAMDSFKTIEDCTNKECLIIPNYINTDEIKEKMNEKCDLKLDKNIINMVTIGRLCHQKGLDIMFKELKELTNYRKDFHMYIIGDGPDKDSLEKLQKELGLEEYITFLGNQKNPFKYLKQMDLFYLSSRYEGQGMVILEAMSVGIDTLIPKHLEKYCPSAKGEKDILAYLKKYKKNVKPKFNSLKEYNEAVTKELEILFS